MKQPKPRTQKSHTCAIEGCTDPAYSLGLCAACYQWDYYWTKLKNAAERRHYTARVARTAHRVETLSTPRLRRVK